MLRDIYRYGPDESPTLSFRRLAELFDLEYPVICTPDELMGI
jgi:hypothetical protein